MMEFLGALPIGSTFTLRCGTVTDGRLTSASDQRRHNQFTGRQSYLPKRKSQSHQIETNDYFLVISGFYCSCRGDAASGEHQTE
jgi:hypothetical protein